jgi:hypothetical protein
MRECPYIMRSDTGLPVQRCTTRFVRMLVLEAARHIKSTHVRECDESLFTFMHVATSLSQPTSARSWQPQFGAWRNGEAWHFRVWAPSALTLELVLADRSCRALTRAPDGSFTAIWPDLRSGDRYSYRIDGKGPFPDPPRASSPMACTGHRS